MELQTAPGFGTRQVARLLGLTTVCIGKALWDGRIPEPGRRPGGRAFLWTVKDIEAASLKLRGRGIEDVREVLAVLAAGQRADSSRRLSVLGAVR